MRRAAVLLLLSACGDPLAECAARLGNASRQLTLLVDQQPTGCATVADCAVVEPKLSCVGFCPAPVRADAVTAFTRQMGELSATACDGLLCKSAASCEAFTVVCVSGNCLRGLPDGGTR